MTEDCLEKVAHPAAPYKVNALASLALIFAAVLA